MDSDTTIFDPESIVDLIDRRKVGAVFQPIVELETGSVVGYEALARGPAGTALEMPSALFAAAEAAGRHVELDRLCREVAVHEALAAGLGAGGSLYLNVEPATLDDDGVLNRLADPDVEPISIVVEFTERTLTTRPAEVLAAVRWLRERNCQIALDDVGVDPRSLALMPFLSPDVIKLDIAIVQERLDPLAAARVLNAVGAEVERTEALLVAEGVETEQQRERAVSLGAVLGQGWLFGRPGTIVEAPASGSTPPVPHGPAPEDDRDLPFDLVTRGRDLRFGDERFVLSLSRQLEDEARSLRGEVVVLSNFEHYRYFTPATRRRFEALAEEAALVAAVGPAMPTEPGRGIRGAQLLPEDAAAPEWDVIVVSPHFAAAFVARQTPRAPTNRGRSFEYLVTYDRPLAVAAARALLSRVLRVA